jgi:hypothetical protein
MSFHDVYIVNQSVLHFGLLFLSFSSRKCFKVSVCVILNVVGRTVALLISLFDGYTVPVVSEQVASHTCRT